MCIVDGASHLIYIILSIGRIAKPFLILFRGMFNHIEFITLSCFIRNTDGWPRGVGINILKHVILSVDLHQ